jgi:hypothetical protein
MACGPSMETFRFSFSLLAIASHLAPSVPSSPPTWRNVRSCLSHVAGRTARPDPTTTGASVNAAEGAQQLFAARPRARETPGSPALIRVCPRASRPRTTAGLAMSVSRPPNPGPWPELNDRWRKRWVAGEGGQAEAFRPLIRAIRRAGRARAALVGARPAHAQGRAGRPPCRVPCGPPCSPPGHHHRPVPAAPRRHSLRPGRYPRAWPRRAPPRATYTYARRARLSGLRPPGLRARRAKRNMHAHRDAAAQTCM